MALNDEQHREIGFLAAALRRERKEPEQHLDFEAIANTLYDLVIDHLNILDILQERAITTFTDVTAEEEVNQLLRSGREKILDLQKIVGNKTDAA